MQHRSNDYSESKKPRSNLVEIVVVILAAYRRILPAVAIILLGFIAAALFVQFIWL